MNYIVDAQATSAYSDIYNKKCSCAWCRNYEETFVMHYPEVAAVLQTFGLHADRPTEIINLFWNDAGDKRLYSSFYSVKGELFEEQLMIYDKDAIVTLYRPDAKGLIYSNTGMEKPYFIIEVANVEVPWVLPEETGD